MDADGNKFADKAAIWEGINFNGTEDMISNDFDLT